jgi:hydrophobic/amphiphilic exporter-1 (mainly G- bacteria), HAE1 family
LNLSVFFIRRPIGASLLAAALLLVGIAAWPRLPVAPLPQVDFPTISVSASLPGAGPETVASNLAAPLERQLAQIPGVEQMTSSSSLGGTSINLQFSLDRDIDAAALDVQSAINAAAGQLPAGMPAPPTYRKINPADRPILTISMRSDALPLTALSDYADNLLAQQLSQIQGVGQVYISGAQKPAIRIQIDPVKIASLGIGLEEVRAAILGASVNLPKGSIDGSAQSFAVYANDQILSPEDWSEAIVAYRNGTPVRVRDIGRAVTDAENTRSAAWAFDAAGASAERRFPGGRAVNLMIVKQPGANVIETVERVKAALRKIEADLPPAIELRLLSDRTQTIRASVEDVELTLVLAIALVVLAIFVFLRDLRATLIGSVTVPLALFGTAAVMYALGYSLDNLSLMALTIAVGFVIDDAIVMLENIYRQVEAGIPPMEAAVMGASEVGFTIVSISASLVAAFIPIFLMGGVVGRFFREFAVTVTVTIALSVLISIALTPALCARLLRPRAADLTHGPLFNAFERTFDWLLDGYRRALDAVMCHRPIALAVFFATLAATVALFVVIPKGFFPQQDTGILSGTAEAGQDISFQGMQQLLMRQAEVLRQDPDIDNLTISYGSSMSFSTVGNSASIYITLKTRDAGRKASAEQIVARLRPKLAAIPGVTLYLQASQDLNLGARSSRTQFQYTLTGADLDELNQWAPALYAKLRTLPELVDLASDQQNRSATAMLDIDRDRAAAFGITPALIDATVYDAIGQRQVTQYFTQVNSYKVILEVSPQLQADPNLFDKLYVTSPASGRRVPLSTFVAVDTERNGFLTINHQGRYPAVTISFNLATGVGLGQAVDAIERASLELKLPPSISGSFQGTAQVFQSSLAGQPMLILSALIAVYVVLGLLYESYIHPLTILSTLPAAGMGALLILMAGGFDLSLIAMIGIILLIGIVKKNGIILVDFALAAERERGLSPEQSIREACLRRFRPILMTSLCAALAGVPLMLGLGTGAELRRPLGYAMVGGLIVSQTLTLFTTPVIYLYLDRLSLRLTRRTTKHATQRVERAA